MNLYVNTRCDYQVYLPGVTDYQEAVIILESAHRTFGQNSHRNSKEALLQWLQEQRRSISVAERD